jgi:hypothetical protein
MARLGCRVPACGSHACSVQNIRRPSKQFYEFAQLFKHIAPGAVRIGAKADSTSLAVFAFRNPDGKPVIVGRSTDPGAIAVHGTLSAVTAAPTLSFSYTTPTQNMLRGAPAKVNDSGAFSVTLPSNCVFTLSSGKD